METVLGAVASDLQRLDDRPRPDAIVAIGGTATNLAAVKHGLSVYDSDVVHGTVLDVAELERQIELYRTRDANERSQLPGSRRAGRTSYSPERASCEPSSPSCTTTSSRSAIGACATAWCWNASTVIFRP